MSTTPLIAIFVRHSADCKYRDDELWRRCNCRKHLRWTQNGKQFRRKAGTRSWAEAENVKREIEDQLAGRLPDVKPENSQKSVAEAVELFLKEKTVHNVSKGVLGKYRRELQNFQAFCERAGAYTVQGITRELLTDFTATWSESYPSSITRAMVKGRLGGFLRYCYQAEWLPRVPQLPSIHREQPETLPLTAAEYDKILRACSDKKVHALVQLMRWSGLAVMDASTLRRDAIVKDSVYRIVAQREKTRRRGTGRAMHDSSSRAGYRCSR